MKTKKYFGKKLLSTLFLLCLITSTVSIQTNASEDINETLLQEKMCDFDSKKKLHKKEVKDYCIEVYDEKGRVIVYTYFFGSYFNSNYYTYNSFDKYQSIIGGDSFWKWGTSYVYDNNQQLDYSICYDNMNHCPHYMISFYDDFERCTSRVSLDENGKESSRYVYTYDSNGNVLIEQRLWEGEETECKIYSYDSNGNILTKQSYRNGEEKEREIYSYDSNGNIFTKQSYRNGEEKEREIYSYDSNGNILTKQSYRNGEEKEREIYSYDSNGNILTKQSYRNGEEQERKIYAYHDNGKVREEVCIYFYDESKTEHYTQYNENGDTLSEKNIHYNLKDGIWVVDSDAYSCYEDIYEYDQDGDLVAVYRFYPLDSYFYKKDTYTYYHE